MKSHLSLNATSTNMKCFSQCLLTKSEYKCTLAVLTEKKALRCSIIDYNLFKRIGWSVGNLFTRLSAT